MSIVDYLRKDFFSLTLAGPARALMQANGFLFAPDLTPDIEIPSSRHDAFNAIEHAMSSALMADALGRRASTIFGDIQERDMLRLLSSNGQRTKDSWGDQWNNEVGRRIVEWADENGYGDDPYAIHKLILDAARNDQLMTESKKNDLPEAIWNLEPIPFWSGPSPEWNTTQFNIPDYSGLQVAEDINGILVEISGLKNWLSDAFISASELIEGRLGNQVFSTVHYNFTKAEDNDFGSLLYAFNQGSYVEIAIKEKNGSIIVDRFSGVENIIFLDDKDGIDVISLPNKAPVWTEKPFTYDKPSSWDPISPLILDLDGDGVETSSLANSNAMFDLLGNGFAIKTAWVGKDDGLLALDINGNGTVDNITELFGNKTTNGFAILSVHDLNADGVIDSQDAVFSNLKIWKDVNSDGISHSSELKSLSEMGIQSISLSFQNINQTNNGNPVTHRSSFSREDGTTGVVDDVWFVNSPIISRHLIPDGFVPSVESLSIPTLTSYGVLQDIVYRFDTNETFANLVSNVISSGESLNISEFEQAVEDMLLNWTGVDSMANPYVSKQFQVLKALHGNTQYRNPTGGGDSPGQINDLYLAAEYSTALQSMAGKMLVQIAARAHNNDNPIFEALSGVFFDRSQDVISGDITGAFSFLGVLASDPLTRDDAMRVSRMIMQSISPTDPLKSSYISTALTSSGFSGADLIEFKGMLEANGVWRSNDSSPDQDAYGLNLFYGSNEKENIYGSLERDIFIASSGGDYLYGGDGNDRYIYRMEAGNIYIGEGKNTSTSSGGNDELIMSNEILPSDIKISSGSNSFDIVLEVGDNLITLIGALKHPDNSVEKIVFSDGTVWNHSYLISSLTSGTDNDDSISGDWNSNIIFGKDGDDIIYGNNGNDTITGGKGNDIISGGNGTDIIIYDLGDGNDVLIANHPSNMGVQSDKIVLGIGILPEDVIISQVNSANDILISISDSGSILVKNGFVSAYDRIQSLSFADGTIWSGSDILSKAMAGTDANDTIVGTSSSDFIFGQAGNDILDGQVGNDTLIGGVGDDLIKSGPGNDIVIYNIGDGNDTLINQGGYFGITSYQPGVDKIMFGNGISVADVSFSQSTNGIDLIANIAGSGTFSISGGISNPNLASFNFSDGTTILLSSAVLATMTGSDGNDTIFGNALANIISGNGGDDTLMGGDGGDTYKYKFGDGNDTIHEWLSPQQAVSGTDILLFGDDIVPSNVRFIGSEKSSDLVVQISDGSKITISNALYHSTGTGFGAIEQYKFADGTIVTAANAFTAARTATALNDVLWGTTSNNTINGLAGDDFIYGGAGVDTINGGDGNDFIDGEGLGITQFAPDILKGGAGDDWIIGDINDVTVMGEDGSDTIDLSRFTTGVTFNLSLSSGQIISSGTTRTWTGFENVVGSAFNDVLTGTTGNNVINGNDGNDTITDHGGIDLISGGAGDDTISLYGSSSGVTTINAGDGKDSVRTVFRGSVFVDLGSGNDFIQAGTSYDVIIGGAGNDYIITGGGEDLISAGDGIDDVEFYNEQAVIVDLTLETVTYSSGITLAFTGVENVYGSNFGDTITGSSAANRLTGYGGNDIIYGLAGSDSLAGSSGDDALYGGDDSDGLNGDVGNDILDGGAGYDTAYFYGKSKFDFQFSTVNGTLTISDMSTSGTNHGVDTLIGMENLYFADGYISVASPIILDLNGDGIQLIDKTLSSASFDFDDDGTADSTGWFSSGDGMLVFDENQNALVDGLNEVSFTNVEGALSDLDGLRKRFDTNDDGVFSDLDLDFGKFGVWQDLNGDGVQDNGEYSTLAQLGISSISLIASAVNQDWQMGENIVVGEGSFVRNGESFAFKDAGFIYDSSLALSMEYEEEIDRGSMLRDSFWSLPEHVTI